MKVSGNDERVQRSTRQTFNHHENERKERKQLKRHVAVYLLSNSSTIGELSVTWLLKILTAKFSQEHLTKRLLIRRLLPTLGTKRSSYWKTKVHKSDSEEISEETV